MRGIGHFNGGAAVPDTFDRLADVRDFKVSAEQAKHPLATRQEVMAVIANAEAAQPTWAATHPQRRASLLRQWLELINRDFDSLARTLALENGKTAADAKDDFQREIEALEFAIGIPGLLKGEDTAHTGADAPSSRQPLGVVAGITAFNVPATIPLWVAASAMVCGNAFILNPSACGRSGPERLAELFLEAGGPRGIFNIVNGDKAAAEMLLEDLRVKAIGCASTPSIANDVYTTAARLGKRAYCFRGTKNDNITMTSADLDQVTMVICWSIAVTRKYSAKKTFVPPLASIGGRDFGAGKHSVFSDPNKHRTDSSEDKLTR